MIRRAYNSFTGALNQTTCAMTTSDVSHSEGQVRLSFELQHHLYPILYKKKRRQQKPVQTEEASAQKERLCSWDLNIPVPSFLVLVTIRYPCSNGKAACSQGLHS